MNNNKITIEGEVARRIKETTKAQKEMYYIVIKVQRGNFSDFFKCKVKSPDQVEGFAVGAKVVAEAFVGGREWMNPTTNKPVYFTDLNLAKISAAEQTTAAGSEDSSEAVDDMPF